MINFRRVENESSSGFVSKNYVERIHEGYTSGSTSSYIVGGGIAIGILAILLIAFTVIAVSSFLLLIYFRMIIFMINFRLLEHFHDFLLFKIAFFKEKIVYLIKTLVIKCLLFPLFPCYFYFSHAF